MREADDQREADEATEEVMEAVEREGEGCWPAMWRAVRSAGERPVQTPSPRCPAVPRLHVAQETGAGRPLPPLAGRSVGSGSPGVCDSVGC